MERRVVERETVTSFSPAQFGRGNDVEADWSVQRVSTKMTKIRGCQAQRIVAGEHARD